MISALAASFARRRIVSTMMCDIAVKPTGCAAL